MLGLYIYIRNTVYKNVKWYDNVVFGSLSVYVQSVIIDTNIPIRVANVVAHHEKLFTQ